MATFLHKWVPLLHVRVAVDNYSTAFAESRFVSISDLQSILDLFHILTSLLVQTTTRGARFAIPMTHCAFCMAASEVAYPLRVDVGF